MTTHDASPARLRRSLLDRLPEAAREALDRIVTAAGPRGGVYAVGGAVRDLLLDRPGIVDLDLTTESDALDLVRAALPSTKVTAHVRFGTASIAVAGIRIDVATARTETYAHPGVLPRVASADIDGDLRRRDFAMNAIALRLSGEPALLDPCGGINDIRIARVRVLHDASFQDDATRIFRAFRYAARLGFDLDPRTATLLRDGVPYIDTVGGERLRREIELTFREPTGGAALEAASAAVALQRIHPALSWDPTRAEALAHPIPSRIPLSLYGFALLAAAATTDDAERAAARLKLTRDESAAVGGIARMRGIAHTLRRPEAKPSGVALLLDRFPLASVAASAAVESDPIARQLTLRYLEEWRSVKPALRGDDLIVIGIPAGPDVQRGLQLLRAARLDGWAADRGDEHALMLRFAKSIRDAKTARAPIKLNLN